VVLEVVALVVQVVHCFLNHPLHALVVLVFPHLLLALLLTMRRVAADQVVMHTHLDLAVAVSVEMVQLVIPLPHMQQLAQQILVAAAAEVITQTLEQGAPVLWL
jgi:hypothetical protein